jgi:outer membrane protein assembly factor BamB
VISVATRSTTSRIETGLGVFGILALGVTLAIVFQWNPWPGIRDWLDERTRTLSEPGTSWTQRATGQPSAVGITDRAVVAFMGDMVESRDRGTGNLQWRKESDWAALAGPPASGIVIMSKVDGKGIDAVEPYSGATRWSDPDAIGAWTFRDAVLTVDCPKSGCGLVNRAPYTGVQRWRIGLPGVVRALAGANSGLLDPRHLDDNYDDVRAGNPQPMPRYLGYLIDRKVQVVDTSAGRRVREEEVPNDARSVVVANRTVRIVGAVRNNGCRFVVIGRDAGSGQQVWQREGYDLQTTGGAGCEPRKDPPGGGTALIAIRGDNRSVVLSAVDGRELAVAAPGESILGTNGEVAVLRSGDGKQIRAINLGTGGAAWTRPAESSAKVGITAYAVFIVDAATDRLVAVDPGSGQVRLDLKSGAEVLGISPTGVVLGRGRTIGWIGFGATA